MKVSESPRYKSALAFVIKKHAAIRYANDVPASHHLARVSERLEELLERYDEGTLEERRAIVIGALGHDVREDTDATAAELGEIFTPAELALIDGMTNKGGDTNVQPYVEKIVASPEEVRLIKLSDLCDNITAVLYTIAVLGKKWTADYFLPVVTPMKEAVLKTSFTRYPNTAQFLKAHVELSYTLLLEEFERTK